MEAIRETGKRNKPDALPLEARHRNVSHNQYRDQDTVYCRNDVEGSIENVDDALVSTGAWFRAHRSGQSPVCRHRSAK